MSSLSFEVGAALDACDTDNTWLFATVVEAKEGQIKIHYEGFQPKWDEWIPTDSQRLAPRGTHAQPRRQPAPRGNWFSGLFGFHEPAYSDVKTKFQIELDRDAKQSHAYVLRSLVNQQAYKVGRFETPSLGELRTRVAEKKLLEGLTGDGKKSGLALSIAIGDVSRHQADPANKHATFQAASQFNCLEFVGPSVVPEQGVTGYVNDPTQGPCCSVAAGPATVFRNYFAPVQKSASGGRLLPEFDVTQPYTEEHQEAKIQIGQTRDCQINNLADFNSALGNEPDGHFFSVTGGYTLASDESLVKMNQALARLDEAQLDNLRSQLRIGVHSDVQVTSSDWGRQPAPADHIVTQIFGSACSVSYSRNYNDRLWENVSRLILEASYEACLLAALENAARHGGQFGSRKVYLTALGGGVFGNSMVWIANAIERACQKLTQAPLEVYIVSYSSHVDNELLKLQRRFSDR